MLEHVPLSEIQGSQSENSISYITAQREEPSEIARKLLQLTFTGNTRKEGKPFSIKQH